MKPIKSKKLSQTNIPRRAAATPRRNSTRLNTLPLHELDPTNFKNLSPLERYAIFLNTRYYSQHNSTTIFTKNSPRRHLNFKKKVRWPLDGVPLARSDPPEDPRCGLFLNWLPFRRCTDSGRRNHLSRSSAQVRQSSLRPSVISPNWTYFQFK